MPHRVKNRLKYVLERWIQRGALYQFLMIAGLIVAVAVGGGLLAFVIAGGFAGPFEAVWWSFLRLTDPGYLGDDEGTALRVISTLVTVLGYVLFMGSLIAILTQWLNQTMRKLESGLTPIAMKGHVLILGWTNRTPAIVHELVLSEGRVARFLRRRGVRRLRIVILAEEVDATLRHELREQVGREMHKWQIILRSGSSLRLEHLHRVDFMRAAVILLPGADFTLGGAEATDARVIKTLLSISNYGEAAKEPPPPLVAEIFDAKKIAIAQRAYQGEIDVVASDAFISRLIAQNVRHRGLSFVYAEILSYGSGNEVYVRPCPEFAGAGIHEIEDAFEEAVVLGAVRPAARGFEPLLNPPPDFRLQEDDRLVLIARTFEESAPLEGFRPQRVERPSSVRRPVPLHPERRILVMGWSHKVFALLREFGSYGSERFLIDVLSVVPTAEREAQLSSLALNAGRVQVRQLEGDYTDAADVEALAPTGYDNVVFLSSDWLETGEETDARTLLGYVLLRSLLPEDGGPEILVELMDPENARLFRKRPGEVIISPVILSHILAHVALRRELSAVFGELFGPGGAEIFFRDAGDYGLAGREVSFREVQHAAAEHGEIALGVRLAGGPTHTIGGVYVNPPAQKRWTLTEDDEIVVLTTYS